MKNIYLIITVVLTVSFLLLPLLAVEKEAEKIAPDRTSSSEITDNNDFKPIDNFKLYLKSEDKIISVSREEYLVGVLAAEMSVDNHEEALKAQTLAAYTFAYRKSLTNKKAGEEYDITDDFSVDQGYLNKEKRDEKWGDRSADNEKRLKDVIKSVDGQLIVYDNQPILAAYHAISSGNTEGAETIWGSEYPYLKSVSSAYDLLSPEYLSEVKLQADDFTQKIKGLGAAPTGEPSSYIGKNEKSTAGTVLKIALCGKEFSGTEIRDAFGLRSAAFDLSFKDDNFIFTVMGYGHGVGMSQFGADYMAKQGSSYSEIISAYYSGVTIVK